MNWEPEPESWEVHVQARREEDAHLSVSPRADWSQGPRAVGRALAVVPS